MSSKGRRRVSSTPSKRESGVPTPRTPRVYYYNAELTSPNGDKVINDVEESTFSNETVPSSPKDWSLSPRRRDLGTEEWRKEKREPVKWNWMGWLAAVSGYAAAAALVRADVRLLAAAPQRSWATLAVLFLVGFVCLAPVVDPPRSAESLPPWDPAELDRLDDLADKIKLGYPIERLEAIESAMKKSEEHRNSLDADLRALADKMGMKETELTAVEEKLESLLNQRLAEWERTHPTLSHGDVRAIAAREVSDRLGAVGEMSQSETKMFEKLLDLWAKDWVGSADWALHSAGAEVDRSRTSATFRPPKSWGAAALDLFSRRRVVASPLAALQPNADPGHCWSFGGSQGVLTVRLAHTIRPSNFSLQHISPDIAYNIESAPKGFQVVGLPESGPEIVYGEFEYKLGGRVIQTFPELPHEPLDPTPVDFISLRVLSNHGHPDFTCIYRFRVHGEKYVPSEPTNDDVL